MAPSISSDPLPPATPGSDNAADAVARTSSSSAQLTVSAVRQACAYVTLLTRDSYLMGVQALARSLRAVDGRHPLIVMHTPDTLSPAAVAALQLEGCQLLPVDRYVPPGRHDFGQYKMQLYGECWTKLRLWELEQYDRLAYLDADMILLRNIDHLFALPQGFYAAPDCTAGRKTQPERDACPLYSPHQPHYFNAGFFLVTPSRADLAHFESLLAAGAVPIGGYAEQDFLNAVYKGVWRPLPHTFNAQRGIRAHHPQLWRQHWPEVAILHLTDAKPWHQARSGARDDDLAELWWQAFCGCLVGRTTAECLGRSA